MIFEKEPLLLYTNLGNHKVGERINSYTLNGINEFTAKVEYYLLLKGNHKISMGINFTKSTSYFRRDTSE